jgi:indolepyruvate ferredoxin oxidoreductase beta subunit
MTVVIGAREYPENIIENLKKAHNVVSVDGQSIALGLGNSKVLNSAVLGFASKYIGFDTELWLNIIESTVPAKTIEINKAAFIEGYKA